MVALIVVMGKLLFQRVDCYLACVVCFLRHFCEDRDVFRGCVDGMVVWMILCMKLKILAKFCQEGVDCSDMPFQRIFHAEDSPPASAPIEMKRNEKRACGRLQCPYLDCYYGKKIFGEVVDLSASGIRVFRNGSMKWKVGDRIPLVLRWKEDAVEVTAEVLRVRRLGFRRFDVGLSFVEISGEVQEAIVKLSRGARFGLQFMTHRDVA